MKFATIASIVPLIFGVTVQSCGEGTPVITEVEFPAEISGDGTSTEGTFTFTDSNAGVRYAYLDNVVCPPGFSCPEADYDLLLVDPNILKYTSAQVTFTHSCSNSSVEDVWFTYSWTVEDIDGNLSEPQEFTYTCQHTGSSTTPVITDLTFPAQIEGNGVVYYGTVSYEDGNAGITTATLTNLVCPSGFECPSATYDTEEIDPDFDTYYEGAFTFGLNCSNLSGSDAYVAYQWTLTDIEGHVSTPAQFGFTCLAPGQGALIDDGSSALAVAAPTVSSGLQASSPSLTVAATADIIRIQQE